MRRTMNFAGSTRSNAARASTTTARHQQRRSNPSARQCKHGADSEQDQPGKHDPSELVRQKMHAHAVGRAEKLRHPRVRLPHTRQRSQLAAKLSALDQAVIKCQSVNVNHDAIAAKEGMQGNHDVVAERVGRNGLGERAAQGVDAARGVEDGVDQRMLLAGPDFIPPINVNVGGLADAVGVDKAQLAGDGANGLVCEIRNQVPQRLRVDTSAARRRRAAALPWRVAWLR